MYTHTCTHITCIHTYTHIYICIQRHTHLHMQTRTHTHVPTYAYTYTHPYIYTHTLIHTCTHTHNLYPYIYTHTHTYTHIRSHTHTCTHIHTHITCIHTYIYTHTEYKAVFISSEQLRGSGGSWERGLAPDSEGLPGQWWVHRGCTLLPRPPVPRLREAVIAAGPGLPARPRWPEKHLEVLGELQRPSRCSVSSRKSLNRFSM